MRVISTKQPANYLELKFLDTGGLEISAIHMFPSLCFSLSIEVYENKLCRDKVFVAMPFSEEFNNVYEVISKVLDGLGYKAIRADRTHFADYIINFILPTIEDSKFVVADLTNNNDGVIYEMGYALGTGKQVIGIIRRKIEDGKDKTFDEIHFDIKQYNFIVYEDLEDLKTKLEDRVKNLFWGIDCNT